MSPPSPETTVRVQPPQVHTLRGSNGMLVEFLSWGGIVTRLLVPDRHGRLANVVLGLPSPTDYLGPHPYFGAITGRVAGRISEARFQLDGRDYPLAANDGRHHLHGGLTGFDRHSWEVTPKHRSDGAPSMQLSRRSPHGEEGYPGDVDVVVTYTVTADNTFIIETEATTNHPTPFNLTHHSYFNLAGEGSGTIKDHRLQILADDHAPAADDMGLLGRRESVTPANDFRKSRLVGEALPILHARHGDLYFLRPINENRSPRWVAQLDDSGSGRRLTVHTTESCLQLYTGAFLDGSLRGPSGVSYGPHAGLCLECQGYADGVNTPALGDTLLRPDHPQRHTTHYAFSVLP